MYLARVSLRASQEHAEISAVGLSFLKERGKSVPITSITVLVLAGIELIFFPIAAVFWI